MAWTYTQDFNALTIGDLTGQDGWSGNVLYDVQAGTTYEGAQAVRADISGSHLITKSITAINAGSVYAAVRKTVNDGDLAYLVLRESGTGVMYIKLNEAGNITLYDSGISNYVTVTAYNANAWYVLNVEFDNPNQANKYRLRVHDGVSWSAFSGWKTVLGGSYTNIDSFGFDTDFWAGGSSVYWDVITPTDPTAPVNAPPYVSLSDGIVLRRRR